MNHEIRSLKMRVIDDQGRQVGVISKQEALDLAIKGNFDLVEIAPDADPPVCRIMNFGKFRYEQTKKERDAKKKQHVIKIKEIKFHPNIEGHDYGVKLRHILDFLKKGNKVKVTMVFRGREMAHIDYGQRLIERLTQDVVGCGAVEQTPKMMGRQIFLTIGPVKQKS